MNKFINIHLNGQNLVNVPATISVQQITNIVSKITKLTSSEFYLTSNGKKITNELELCYTTIDVNLRILGGKGGFGSMLRAIGAQIEKTTNREACRDLSGRRLRDINEEKRLKAWLDKQKDRDDEAREKKRKKIEKLMAVPKHEFKDSEYENQRSELTENVSDAVQEGLKKVAETVATKRKSTNKVDASKSKKAALWIDDDLSSSTESSDSNESDSENESQTKTVSKQNNQNGESSKCIVEIPKPEELSKNTDDNSKSDEDTTESSTDDNSKLSTDTYSESSSGGSAIEK